jgi:hypothetical protein
MRPRDLRRALLRAALAGALVGALIVVDLLSPTPPAAASVVTALAACLLLVPIALVELAAARAEAAGREVDVVARTWALTVALLPLLAIQHAYVDALARTGALAPSFTAAFELARSLAREPLPLLVGLPIVATPVALAATLRARRSVELHGLGTFLLAVVGLPILCLAPLALVALVACAALLVGLYALADRLERRWRWWDAREQVAALARRLEVGELTPAQVRLLAHLGDEAACAVLREAEPDDGPPDPHVWTKGLLHAAPRAIARAAVAAARLAGPGAGERGAAALAAAEACLADASPGSAARAREAVDGWTPGDRASRAVVEAVHCVAERQPWCGVDAVRAAISATGDADAVRAAIRLEVERHLDEVG